METYLLINLFSVVIPLLASFHARIKLYKYWKALCLSILLAMTPYILWDICFTKAGFWGFNDQYLLGMYLFRLPLEEWLFFICIPFSCIFTHVALNIVWPGASLGERTTNRITLTLIVLFVALLIVFHLHIYTMVDMVFALAILMISYKFDRMLLRSYYITFLFMLIPFFIVNGILTGTGIRNEVVWYNEAEIIGIRLFTIPVEDIAYAFSLILLNLLIFNRFKNSKYFGIPSEIE